MPNEVEELLCTTNWRVKIVEALARPPCSATVDKQRYTYMESSLSRQMGNWSKLARRRETTRCLKVTVLSRYLSDFDRPNSPRH
ncbi:hypothetical protein T02_5512 [Trichinella nativa]|uniref:Uncharacterized protein n=3 Tax=Trichinella TaxID=6333 RepID=A0A0V1LD10_9BILA|nr:hypothetical protein T01_5720 [Trichinella spiralis]KRY54003.1 hypothetical protein T03_6527 [Trichinella britovi]KRZ57412.1 hypothetical protein T02_5512 [Trichinella nativa]